MARTTVTVICQKSQQIRTNRLTRYKSKMMHPRVVEKVIAVATALVQETIPMVLLIKTIPLPVLTSTSFEMLWRIINLQVIKKIKKMTRSTRSKSQNLQTT